MTITRVNALSEIFGTENADQANVFLSHCLKVLKPDEAGDADPANDERHFLLSIIRDIAPRDPVERMLAVQMAATHVATIRSGRWLAILRTSRRCRLIIRASTNLPAPSPPRSSSGYVVQPKPWVIERTFAWACINRFLARDVGCAAATVRALFQIAMIKLMSRRLARFRHF